MSEVQGTKINQLLASTNPSGLLFSCWLKEQGYSEQLQKRYRDCGWLESLSKGVMCRKGGKLSAEMSLATCNRQTGATLRVAAHSALEHAGFSHYVPMGKPVLRVALPTGCKRPAWMDKDCFDMTFKTFSTEAFPQAEIITEETEHGLLCVSSPEQAFFECLLLAPREYDYVDLYYIMEQLTTLRADVVQRLLETVDNFRVKRLFLYMAEKAGHYWVEELRPEKINLGTSKLQLYSDGVYNAKYKITIPKALESYEG